MSGYVEHQEIISSSQKQLIKNTLTIDEAWHKISNLELFRIERIKDNEDIDYQKVEGEG